VEADDAGVGEVVFGGDAVGGIDEESQDEGRGGEDGQGVSVGNTAIKGCNGDEQDQRIHRQQIAGEQRSAEDAEEEGVG